MPLHSSLNTTISSNYTVGVMSGTSHDGLDICVCKFNRADAKWKFEIIKATTIEYSQQFKEELIGCTTLSGEELWDYHCFLGRWIGQQVNGFIADIPHPISLIGSHGHTLFHNPTKGYTAQIGHGAYIAAETGIPCVCDFRSGDVARGGQGAPLVPIGDELLFAEYDFCLNLGGIANISYRKNGQRVAFDICPANMPINLVAQSMGMEMDRNGELAQKGKVDHSLLNRLNELEYFKNQGAKSLGREWFESHYKPIITDVDIQPQDILRTIYENIAIQISKAINDFPLGQLLITGGGANNTFLVRLISEKYKGKIIVPQQTIIDFKEALIFGFLALLYQQKQNSCLASVTGALADSIGGCMYY